MAVMGMIIQNVSSNDGVAGVALKRRLVALLP